MTRDQERHQQRTSNSNTTIMDPLLRKFDTALSNYYEVVRRHYFTINKSRSVMLLQSSIIPRVRKNTLLIQYQSSNKNRTRWTKNMNYAESSSSSNNSRITARIAFFSSSAATISFLCSFSDFTRAFKDVTAKPGRVPTSRDAFERDISFLT
jgi:hypothetical protein